MQIIIYFNGEFCLLLVFSGMGKNIIDSSNQCDNSNNDILTHHPEKLKNVDLKSLALSIKLIKL